MKSQRESKSPSGMTAAGTLHSRPPLERMLRIHQALQSGKYPNASTLAREIEVATKTVHLSAAQHLRDRIKAATPHAVVDVVRRARARLLSRGLPRNAVFAQPPE